MSLDKTDIATIRDVVLEALDVVVVPRFDALEADMVEVKDDVRVLKQDMREVKSSLLSLEGKVAAIEDDIKELYAMVADVSKSARKWQLMGQKLTQTQGHVRLVAQATGVIL